MSTNQDTERLANEAKQEFDRTNNEAKQLADEATETVERRGREQLDRLKDEAADRAEQAADAIEEATQNVSGQGDGSDAVAGYGNSMASFMRHLAGGLREEDIDQFASELSDYARRSPGLFLAGSVALGFGISRFLKASTSHSHRDNERYELGFEDDYESDDADEEYDFDSALRPAPTPEVAPRDPSDNWPADSKDRAATDAEPRSAPSSSTGPAASDATPPIPPAEWAPGATHRMDPDRNLSQGGDHRG